MTIRITKSERFRRNKQAFSEIVGDPYQVDPIQGHYAELKASSGVKVVGVDVTAATGTVNLARPCLSDFFCDVESAVEDGLNRFGQDWREPDQVKFIFTNTYMIESSKYYVFNQQERAKLEQIIGNIFIARGISPVSKYFTTIRK